MVPRKRRLMGKYWSRVFTIYGHVESLHTPLFPKCQESVGIQGYCD
jgi:hypothetical protein